MQTKGVIIDTSVFISFLRGAEAAPFVIKLLKENKAYINGIIIAELIQGLKNFKEESNLIELLKAVNTLEITVDIWIKAGKLSLDLKRKGINIPLTDVATAALAFEHDMELYTFDKHFDLIPGLKIYKP
ncbi:PIN domain-containing protein [Thermodesulfovibrio yellowstonii]|uniref:PIN domain, putative n=2 Tax=Thermodesulfovibrio yellowstonii TaxID=28262 RepID=B5YJK4_THEYD|nr:MULTISPECIES: PIN domain-containing protein [Thermodesulfovibrio]ACI21120.1 PIN domain, putative [Thermodesulfovibrio yellowstonii DSM 11347]MDI6864328.1 PIN domain-containing protein [Thermodesulfovibrio yellowstonii]GLI54054.1 PIN domain protein [Thermodesulfovibrio islandicus]